MCQNPTPFEPPPCQHSAGGRHISARLASTNIHTHRCASRVFSVRRSSGSKPKKHVSVRHPLVLADASQSAARLFAAVKGRRESSETHTSCPCCIQRASLCRRAVPPRRLPSPQARARRVLKSGTHHITMVCTRGELGGPSCGGTEGECAGCARLLTRGKAL